MKSFSFGSKYIYYTFRSNNNYKYNVTTLLNKGYSRFAEEGKAIHETDCFLMIEYLKQVLFFNI